MELRKCLYAYCSMIFAVVKIIRYGVPFIALATGVSHINNLKSLSMHNGEFSLPVLLGTITNSVCSTCIYVSNQFSNLVSVFGLITLFMFNKGQVKSYGLHVFTSSILVERLCYLWQTT